MGVHEYYGRPLVMANRLQAATRDQEPPTNCGFASGPAHRLILQETTGATNISEQSLVLKHLRPSPLECALYRFSSVEPEHSSRVS